MHKEFTIEDIIDRVDVPDGLTIPTVQELTQYNESFIELKDALDVINEYKSRDAIWDPQKMVQDALYLSAVHASMSEVVGYAQSLSTRQEDSKKYIRSSIKIDITSARDKIYEEKKQFIKVTDSFADDISRKLSKDATESARDAEIVSRILCNGWYAINDFIRVLQSAINRANREADRGAM